MTKRQKETRRERKRRSDWETKSKKKQIKNRKRERQKERRRHTITERHKPEERNTKMLPDCQLIFHRERKKEEEERKEWWFVPSFLLWLSKIMVLVKFKCINYYDSFFISCISQSDRGSFDRKSVVIFQLIESFIISWPKF